MDEREMERKEVYQRRAERHKELVALAAKMYGMAKVVLTILTAYDVEVCIAQKTYLGKRPSLLTPSID